MGNLSDLVDALDVHLDACGIASIGDEFSIRCRPCNSLIIHFILRGEGYLLSEFGRLRLATRSVVIVPAGLAVSIRGSDSIAHYIQEMPGVVSSDGLVSLEAVEASAGLVLGSATLTASGGTEPALFRHLSSPRVERAEAETTSPLFEVICGELARPKQGTKQFVSVLMRRILGMMMSSSEGRYAWDLIPDDSAIAPIVLRILKDPGGRYDRKVLANSSGLSWERLRNRFLRSLGCTPADFVQSVRISSAARLLLTTGLSLPAIAKRVGHNSASHFNKAFQRHYGVTPSVFRATPFR